MHLHTQTEREVTMTKCISERELIIDLVRRWGNATSDAVLDPSSQIFFSPKRDGLIAYRLESDCAVVFGDPVCAPEEQCSLAKAFYHFCLEQNWKIIFIAASEQFAKWAREHICKVLLRFGDESVMDPHDDPRERTGTNASLVRRKSKQPIKEGATINEYLSGSDPSLEAAIEEVGDLWLKNRKGPQVHISHVHLFDNRVGKRWFYVTLRDEVVGVVVLNQLQAKQGWLLNHLMITPAAPNGTPELLVVTALETLAKEGCHYVTFGSVPARHLTEVDGFGIVYALMARLAFSIANRILNLEGRRTFWEKFHPQNKGTYLLFSHARVGLQELLALKRGLNISF